VIRLGIVGCNYGRSVLLPAFRLDPRCQVVALAGSQAARTADLARESGVEAAFGHWEPLIESSFVDAVAIATPPQLQPEIAVAALGRSKPVFAEKPMAGDLEGAAEMLQQARTTPTMIDFGFIEIAAWRQARTMIEAGAIGRLRHVTVNWHVENASTRLRLRNWKTDLASGGGALGNLASHSLHYLEWFCGPIVGLSARLSGLPDDPAFQTNVAASLAFASGAAGSYTLSAAAHAGSGHRLEFYGDDGALVLENPTADYMRGFTLRYARRPGTALTPVPVEDDPVDRQFPHEGRIAPVSRLVARFLDGIERKEMVAPGFAEGYRIQLLLDAVRRSHDTGRWLEVESGVS
jgi:predicted dehydrogenase